MRNRTAYRLGFLSAQTLQSSFSHARSSASRACAPRALLSAQVPPVRPTSARSRTRSCVAGNGGCRIYPPVIGDRAGIVSLHAIPPVQGRFRCVVATLANRLSRLRTWPQCKLQALARRKYSGRLLGAGRVVPGGVGLCPGDRAIGRSSHRRGWRHPRSLWISLRQSLVV